LQNKILMTALLDLRWLIAIFVVGPLIAVLAVTFALMVSSRVNDPRAAEQISMVVILPVLAGFFGQVAGIFVLNARIISVVAVVMLILDAVMLYLTTRVFQRELILTRWK
jgi:ABC-2 type transport system permease protein